MKRYITREDLVDFIHKIRQRGVGFILSKLNINKISRTENTFNLIHYKSADWWTIPKVQQRWNRLISGNPEKDYKAYLVENFLKDKSGLRMISLGSGMSSHEIELAKYPNFEEIICIDVAQNRMKQAETTAQKLNLKNIKFICADINNYPIQKDYYDIVFFHASLHHFDNIKQFVSMTIKQSIRQNGYLVINEFVGATRLQFSKNQITKINEALKIIPDKYKIRNKSNLLKKRFYGAGIIRMIIADPSECVDSNSILPAIHSNFQTIVEKPYGGNILMSVLKDISHHFIDLDAEKSKILDDLFAFEDRYLVDNPSDFVFGIYQKQSS